MNDLDFSRVRLRRRGFLAAGGAAVLLAACGDDDASPSTTLPSTAAATSPSTSSPPTTSPASTASASTDAGAPTTEAAATTTLAASALTSADFEGLGTCSLLPEKTAGPFPLEEQFDRTDITEGYDGHPLRLGLRVLDESCVPVPGAAVEIWHCDATGDYSAFADGGGGKDEGEGSTFMRGTQTANDDGIVEFLTVYPGWYSGRAVHIHLRVHLADATVVTSQLFFDETYMATVYADAPYAEFGMPDTANASDSIAGDPGAEGTVVVTTPGETSRGTGTLGLLNLGIDPSARSSASGGAPGGGSPP